MLQILLLSGIIDSLLRLRTFNEVKFMLDNSLMSEGLPFLSSYKIKLTEDKSFGFGLSHSFKYKFPVVIIVFSIV